MHILNTSSPAFKPKITILIYGHGGVGKTTTAASAPSPILIDFEGGSKYFGLRGISIDVAQVQTWDEVRELYKTLRTSKYESVIIDPVGEAMEKLMNSMIEEKKSKLVQPDGQPTMAGWGYLKDNMRRFVKSFRDMDKHLILIAHVEEKADDEGAIKKRPMIRTKLSQELINMVDIVAYMEVIKDSEGNSKRILRIQPNSDKYEAKDRTGQLGEIVEPDIAKIIDGIQGNKMFAWLKKAEKNDDDFDASLDAAAKPPTTKVNQLEKVSDDFANSLPKELPGQFVSPIAPAAPVDPVLSGDTVDQPTTPPAPELKQPEGIAEWRKAISEAKTDAELIKIEADIAGTNPSSLMRRNVAGLLQARRQALADAALKV